MLKTRNIDKINSIALLSKEISNELKNNENELLTKIEKIRDYYQGAETDKIITKFIEGTKKIDLIIEDINYYTDYLEKISGSDKYTLGVYYKRLSNINSDGIKEVGDK